MQENSKIEPQKWVNSRFQEIVIKGNWKIGWAMDLHTLSSQLASDGHFENEYTPIGYALNALKYHNEREYLPLLANEMVKFLKSRLVTPYIHVILPTPASKQRDFQPVYELALEVGRQLNKRVDLNFIKKVKSTTELKSITDPYERKEILNGAFDVRDENIYHNKKVLIIDDLFRSGSTLNEVSSLLYSRAKVQDVYVVTLTKTRVNK